MLPWRGMKRELSRRNRLESGLSVSAVARSRGVSRATVHRSILMAKVRETKPDRRRPDQRDDVRRRPTTCAVWWGASPEDTRLPEARVAWKLNNRSMRCRIKARSANGWRQMDEAARAAKAGQWKVRLRSHAYRQKIKADKISAFPVEQNLSPSH